MATDKKPLTREEFVLVSVLLEVEKLKDMGLVAGGVFDIDREAAQALRSEGLASGFTEPTPDEITEIVRYCAAGGQCEKDFSDDE